ncbi:hypothetical protein C482_03306 [Natrialba chahannaoensis JCM 10990]|uniref:SHOCT domain-containing protein n=1 Tax=Natrialba chahannaoensis JCM 10990 TaxID=1227492 RepID=M0B554_9EURY|nr:hypothetical protein [Natrialba chahannaoensis]ELZ04789.1 hypothetical protein C482_03306 [Natrialba chahannaoensis JCM 10990]
MALPRLASSSAVADVGDLVLLVSIPFLVAISLLGLFGFITVAAAISIVFVVAVVPLLLLFGDSLLRESTDDENDSVATIREQYVDGDLSEAELERAVERELSGDDGKTSTGADEDTVSPSETERSPEHERR